MSALEAAGLGLLVGWFLGRLAQAHLHALDRKRDGLWLRICWRMLHDERVRPDALDALDAAAKARGCPR